MLRHFVIFQLVNIADTGPETKVLGPPCPHYSWFNGRNVFVKCPSLSNESPHPKSENDYILVGVALRAGTDC